MRNWCLHVWLFLLDQSRPYELVVICACLCSSFGPGWMNGLISFSTDENNDHSHYYIEMKTSFALNVLLLLNEHGDLFPDKKPLSSTKVSRMTSDCWKSSIAVINYWYLTTTYPLRANCTPSCKALTTPLVLILPHFFLVIFLSLLR